MRLVVRKHFITLHLANFSTTSYARAFGGGDLKSELSDRLIINMMSDWIKSDNSKIIMCEIRKLEENVKFSLIVHYKKKFLLTVASLFLIGVFNKAWFVKEFATQTSEFIRNSDDSWYKVAKMRLLFLIMNLKLQNFFNLSKVKHANFQTKIHLDEYWTHSVCSPIHSGQSLEFS